MEKVKCSTCGKEMLGHITVNSVLADGSLQWKHFCVDCYPKSERAKVIQEYIDKANGEPDAEPK